MKILFLARSRKPYRDRCLVGLFENSSFKELLKKQNIPSASEK